MSASPRLAPWFPSRETRSQSAGGAGRRREGARARRSRVMWASASRRRPGDSGAGDWRRCAANAPPAGSPPDGGTRGSIDRARRRISGTRARDRSTGFVNDTRRLCSRSRTRHAGSPAPRMSLRWTEPEVVLEQALEGKKPRRAPTRRPHPGQGGGRRANGLSRRAKLRSGRAGRLPASPTNSSREGRGNASFFNGREEPSVPAHASGEPSGEPRQRVGTAGKAPEKLGSVAPGGGRTRTHTEATARESGYGSSRGERSEGRLQERERHGTRPRSVGAPRKPTGSARGSHDP
jgi:hypothetical protein